jgi:hypothetical protein
MEMQGSSYCKYNKMRIESDGGRFSVCGDRDQDADEGKKGTCFKCTGFRVVRGGKQYTVASYKKVFGKKRK